MKKETGNLKISFLGGVGEVGKNIMAVEYGNDILIIDAGLGFPSSDMMGVDVVIPDITYLQANLSKIRGIILTHGHLDHIGSLQYILQDLKGVPVYGSKLTIALVENKLREARLNHVKTQVVKDKQKVKIGCFNVEFIRCTHSIAGSMSFAIQTPVGLMYHSGDFKFDYTPIDGAPTDLRHLAELGSKGVLLMTAESTNAERPGYSMSERTVGETLDSLFLEHKDNRIIIATFSSNIHRIQQILNLCEKYGRKVVFTGRSMLNNCDAASKVGELTFNRELLTDVGSLKNYEDSQICILCTGSQGEPHSALLRMVTGDFKGIEITNNDYVIFSSSSIPGNEENINNVINLLYTKGADVVYESLRDVHASGHAYREELKLLHNLIKPKFFIPCHGEFRHLRAHAELAVSLGMDKRHIVIPDMGDTISVGRNSIKKSGTVPAGIKLVDGLDVSEANSAVQRDRMQLAEEGICIVAITVAPNGALTSNPQLIARGFLNVKDNENIIKEAEDITINTIISSNFNKTDWSIIKNNIKKNLTNLFFKKLKHRPMILPLIIETK